MTRNIPNTAEMLPYAAGRTRISTLSAYLTVPSVLFAMLWLGLNTGPWELRRAPENLLQTLHTIRAAFPLVVPLLALVYVIFLRPGRDREQTLPGSLRLWTAFGTISLLATIAMSPRGILDGVYWDLAYLGSLAVMAAYLRQGDPLTGAIRANYLTWLINGAFLLVLVLLARDALMADLSHGYGLYGRTGRSVAEMSMSRSSGMARFAAVPGVSGFVLFMKGKRLEKLAGIALLLPSAWLIFYMQSRGAMIGFIFAILFSAALLGRGGRILLVFVVFFGVSAVLLEAVPERWVDHITRGTDWEMLQTLGGRTRTWDAAWPAIGQSPIWGWGSRADRVLLRQSGIEAHIHNTYLYALLAGGILGAGFFVAGLIRAWHQLIKLMRAGIANTLGQQTTFAQVGGILAFFTVRSIPEVSGPLYAVDLLVMLPAVLYIGVLYRQMHMTGNGKQKNVESRTQKVECGT